MCLHKRPPLQRSFGRSIVRLWDTTTAAGTTPFNYQFATYYGITTAQLVVCNSFLSGQTDVAGLTKGLQDITDKIANDSSVKKLKVS